ncbi:MAG: DUF4406 domain-containing protein [Taibaiella sp.]|nr:DUF4406 domain-containing protein [Taibaiella sp.]
MQSNSGRRWYIMIAGPYKGSSDDPQVWHANFQKLNHAAFEIFKKGHIPVIGVNAALPVIAAAGEAHYEDIMMPVSLAFAEKCDAVLRIEGYSRGADQEVNFFVEKGLPVFYSLPDIPAYTGPEQ